MGRTARNVGAEHSWPHVLLVLDQFPKTLGGGERIVLKLATLLPEYGYRVSILTFAAHPDGPGIASSPCPVYLLPIERTYDVTALRAARELRGFLRDQQVRIVQTFFESSDLWAGLVTKTVQSAKLVWSRRDMGILRTSKHHIAYRLMARAPDAVFAVSEQVRDHCIEVDRVPSSRVTTVYNGLDLADWEMMPRVRSGAARIVIATVGNIRRVKGHDVFVRAAALVHARFPEVCFSIAGEVLEAEFFAELEILIREQGLSDHFHFVGGITDLQEHLRVADLFVLPSRSEGFSNAIIEAMAASLPVIATDVGGNSEAVEEGVSGFIVPPEDPTAIAEAITRLLEDPALARQMGVAGREAATNRFTTSAMLNSITGVYANLLEKDSADSVI